MARPAVLEVSPQAWKQNALDYLVNHAIIYGHVTADDLRAAMPGPPHHHNAIGPIFRTARARKLLVKVWPHESTAGPRNGGGSFAWGLHPDQMKGAAR